MYVIKQKSKNKRKHDMSMAVRCTTVPGISIVKIERYTENIEVLIK